MMTIAYLIEDVAVGGVMRTMAGQVARLGQEFQIVQHVVNADRPLPPAIPEDAVVIHFTPAWSKLPFLTLLRAQKKRPIVLVEHMYTDGFERLCVPNQMRFRTMLRLVYRLVDYVVCVSEGQARWIEAAGLAPAEKLRVVPSASDCSPLLEVPPPVRAPGEPLRLGAYGRYSWQKGYDYLIEAMRSVDPAVATLELAGYGEDEAALHEQARGMPHVRIGRSITDLPAYLARQHAIVVPSRWEAFGLVATEARTAARPIIVADHDGLSEQVCPSTGIAVKPHDPQALAEAIRKLATMDVTTMGLAAREAASSHFERHIKGYRDLFRELEGTEPVGSARPAAA